MSLPDLQSIIKRSERTINETMVLSCVLQDPKIGKVFSTVLKEDDFLDARHKRLYNTITELVTTGKTPDLHGVASFFNDAELSIIGGVAYLEDVMHAHTHPEKFMEYVKRIKEQTTRRSLVRAMTMLVKAIDSGEPTSDVMRSLNNITKKVGIGMENEDGAIDPMIEHYLTSVEAPGIDTGFPDIDKRTGGMHKGTLWGLAGYSGSYKTFTVIHIINNVLIRDPSTPVAFFSLEMKPDRIVRRLVNDLECRKFDIEKLKTFDLRIFNKKRTIAEIEYAIMAHAPRIVFIDYLQLVDATGRNEYEQIKEVAIQFQRMCQEYACTIIALSQVPNEAMKSGSDSIMQAKGGGSFPAACDVFLELKKVDEDIVLPRAEVEMFMKKNRDGQRYKSSYQFDNQKAYVIPQDDRLVCNRPVFHGSGATSKLMLAAEEVFGSTNNGVASTVQHPTESV